MRKTISNKRSAMSGAAMIETIIAFPALMFLGFGILHLGLIYQAKANLEYAALMAARMASTSGFYSLENPDNNFFDSFQEEVRYRMLASDSLRDGAAISDTAELSKVSIMVVRPNQAIFQQFGEGDCPETQCLIPNDNLLYRSTNTVVIDGLNVNIQDANILQLSVSYKYNSGVPFMNKLFSVDSLDSMDAFLPESEKNPISGTPGMKITAVATVRMQTDAQINTNIKCFFAGYC